MFLNWQLILGKEIFFTSINDESSILKESGSSSHFFPSSWFFDMLILIILLIWLLVIKGLKSLPKYMPLGFTIFSFLSFPSEFQEEILCLFSRHKSINLFIHLFTQPSCFGYLRWTSIIVKYRNKEMSILFRMVLLICC